MRHAPLACVLAACSAAPSGPEPARGARPNFIIVLADDMGYGDSSVYGGRFATPALERLAREGLLFTDFHTSGNVCSPTRAGLLTGRYQHRAGIKQVVFADPQRDTHTSGLADEERTLPELLGEAGYRTALCGKWHLGYLPPFNPTRHGFDEFRGFVSGNIDYHSHHNLMEEHDWWHGMQRVREEGYLTDLITRDAVRFIEESADEPFFLCVSHGALHTPLQTRADGPVRGPNAGPAPERPREETVRGMLVALDESVGAVLDAVEEAGLAERTYVVFLSDNGGAGHADNGPLRRGKGSPYEGGHRVPALLRGPGVAAGTRSDALCSSLDVMPTFLELAGVAPAAEKPLDGQSLASHVVRGEALPARRLFWGAAVRDGPWKLVVGYGDGPQLYDLAQDLGEAVNLAQREPERVEALRAHLRAWRADVHE